MALETEAHPSFASIESHSDLIEYTRAYAREARREWVLDVRFDLVGWEVSTRARRRAAAVKRPNIPTAEVGAPIDWERVAGSDGRPLPCTVSLTWAAFEAFSREEWNATLRHELLHVEQFQRYGTTDHGDAFQDRAAALETDVHCRTFATPKWRFRCESCGAEVARRYRDCEFVREYDQYRSECCGASLVREDPE